MSYNGIGLASARGSGTNGYVTRNLGLVKASNADRRHEFAREGAARGPAAAAPPRPVSRAILEHEAKRRVEGELLALRESLEAQGRLTGGEVDARVAAVRATLEANLARAGEAVVREGGVGAAGRGETAAMGAAKEAELARARRAWGIGEGHVVGAAMIYQDNQSVITLVRRGAPSHRTKHIKIRNYFLK